VNFADVTLPSSPDIPTTGTATSGTSNIAVSWVAPASNGGSSITGYKVSLFNEAGTLVGAEQSTSVVNYDFTGVDAGVYTVKVKATNIVGDSSFSLASNSVTIAAPSANTSTPSAPAGGTALTSATTFKSFACAIRAKLNPNPPDISQVLTGINTLLDNSITGHTIREEGPPALDLSKINFEALAKRFEKSKHKNTELEVLKAAIRAKLEKMVELNRTRADFAEKFEALIESYNAGSRTIEALYQELLALTHSLNDEEQRHVRENMTEEELVIFDILTRPSPELGTEERAEVKKVARDLLERLKALLVLNWREKSTARSQLKLTIEDTLDTGLPRVYTPEIYQQKCSAVFEHVFESYPERNAGVYS
jgi:type I restriction enzyme R subunit